MKVLIFMFFSGFMFWGTDDAATKNINTASETSICTEGGGGWHCQNFNDGGDCVIGIFEDGGVAAFGDDC